MAHNSTPQPFNESWKPEHARYWFDKMNAENDEATDAEKAAQRSAADMLFRYLSFCCGQHLAWCVQQGTLKLPEHTQHAKVPFLTALRALIEQPDDQDRKIAAGAKIANILEPVFFDSRFSDYEAKHSEVCKRMLAGDFDFSKGDTYYHKCQLSGKHIDIISTKWTMQAYLSEITKDSTTGRLTRKRTPLSPDDIIAPKIEITSFPAPSGNILIGHLDQIPEIQNIINLNRKALGVETQSFLQGRAAFTHLHAALGMGHLNGYDLISILQDEHGLHAGELDPDAPTPESLVGQLNDVRYWASFIDRQQLYHLLRQTLKHEDAEQRIVKFLEYNPETVQANIPPGEYHLYFAGHPSVLSERIDQDYDTTSLDARKELKTTTFHLLKTPLLPHNPTPEIKKHQMLRPSR